MQSGAQNALDKLREAFALSDSKPQKVILEDSVVSPDGKWVAERYSEIFRYDVDTKISLHHTGENLPEIPIPIPYKSVAADVRFKWLDNSTLLIATEEDVRLETTPDEYYGVRLQYGHYSEDPDMERIAESEKIYTRTVAFDFDFKNEENIGLPNIGCSLKMTAEDGEYLKSVPLIISAQKEYPHGEWKHQPEDVYGVAILTAQNNAIKPLAYETAVKLQGFSPELKNRRQVGAGSLKEPLGNFMLSGKEKFNSLMSKIKNGGLQIKVGFWFDNIEVIYKNAVPKDQSAIEAFEQCIRQNGIGQKAEK